MLDLDDLQRRTAATPAGPANPAAEAKKQALSQRIGEARSQAAGELARRDRMERLRNEGAALRRDGLAQKEKIRNADASMARMRNEFQGKYPQKPLKASDLTPEDRARYKAAKDARDAAQKKLEKDREGFAKKKDEYEKLKKEADEKEKAEGEKEGDVGDPCVSCIASEVEKLEEEAKKDEEERLALARELTKTGGTGTVADKELVAKELAKLPKSTLEQMKANGTKVVACRGSVTNYRSDLRGVHPRDWPAGKTWDSVPGAYTQDRNEVVVATTGHGTPAGAHVPGYGEGHGSANLTVHEAMHGVDSGGSGPDRSTATDFNTARNGDLRNLDSYENKRNDTKGGQEETWAESAARYYSGQGPGNTPNLHEYWRSHTPGASPPSRTGASGGRGP
jgi:hypothetical protein